MREEDIIIIKKLDGNYNIKYKKPLLNSDGDNVGWLYVDVPNVRLNDDNVYVIEPNAAN